MEDQVLLDIIESAQNAGETEGDIARIIAEYEAQHGPNPTRGTEHNITFADDGTKVGPGEWESATEKYDPNALAPTDKMQFYKNDVELESSGGDYVYQQDLKNDKFDFLNPIEPVVPNPIPPAYNPVTEEFEPPPIVWNEDTQTFSGEIKEGEHAEGGTLPEITISDEEVKRDENGRRINWFPPSKETLAKEINEELKDDKKESKEGKEDEFVMELPIAEPDATIIGKGTDGGGILGGLSDIGVPIVGPYNDFTIPNAANYIVEPSIEEKERIPDYYWDGEKVVEQTYENVDDILNEDTRPFVFNFDGERVYFDEQPIVFTGEVPETTYMPDAADQIWLNKYMINPLNNLYDITADLISNPNERAILALNTKKIIRLIALHILFRVLGWRC